MSKSKAHDNRIETILLVDAAYPINTKRSATASCTECTPLLRSRPVRNGNRINFPLLSLGILLFGGIAVGSYLLVHDNRSIPVKLVFDMVDRSVWDSGNVFAVGRHLNSANVRNIYIMQTNGVNCHNYAECVAMVRHMQVMLPLNPVEATAMETQNSSLPYNFLIGGDGETYEIRGWSEQSGFSFVPHSTSLTIGILGSFSKGHPPPDCQLAEACALISESLRRHKIAESYQIYGIRNTSISATNSEALLKSVSEWDHWNSTVNFQH